MHTIVCRVSWLFSDAAGLVLYKRGPTSELVWSSGPRAKPPPRLICFVYEPPPSGELRLGYFVPRFVVLTTRCRLVAVSDGGMLGGSSSMGL